MTLQVMVKTPAAPLQVSARPGRWGGRILCSGPQSPRQQTVSQRSPAPLAGEGGAAEKRTMSPLAGDVTGSGEAPVLRVVTEVATVGAASGHLPRCESRSPKDPSSAFNACNAMFAM